MGLGCHWYWSDVQSFLPLHALSKIEVPSTIKISEQQVACSVYQPLLSLASSYPTRTEAMKSSVMKESFFSWGYKLAVFYSRDRFFSHINSYLCEIQELVMQKARMGK